MPDFLFAELSGQNINSSTKIVQTNGREVVGQGAGLYVADTQANAALMAAHPRLVARSSNNRYFRALPDGGRIPVELAGAKADGVTDDGPAIRAAASYARAIGAQGIRLAPVRYRVEKIPPSEQVLNTNPPIQLISTDAAIDDYGGAQFTRQSGGRGLVHHPATPGTTTELPLAASVTAGSREGQLQAGLGAQLTVGDWVMWQLGEFPYDPAETPNWDFARVEAVTGDLVRLDKPVPLTFSPASVAGANKRLRKLRILRDHVIRDLTLSGTDVEDGISLYAAQRVTIERVGGVNVGAGTVVAQYCDGLTINDCWQDGWWTGQTSFGAAFAFAETRNCLLNRPRARGTISLVKAEAGAEVTVIDGNFENTALDASGQSRGTDVVVINALGSASVTVHDLTVTGFGGYRLIETSNGQPGYEGVALLSGTTRLEHPSAPFSIPLGAITGTLDLTIAGTREIYNFARLRHWRRRFVLRDGEYLYAYGPPGILAKARAYASSGLTIGGSGQLTGFWLGRQSDNGSNLADGPAAQLQPGIDAYVPCLAGTVGGASWTFRNEPLAILCTTAAAAGLNAANEFVEFEGWFAQQQDLDTAVSEAAMRSGGDGRDPLEALFPAYDLPAIGAGAVLAVLLPIPDMVADDFIDAVRITGGLGALELRGAEAQVGAARLTFANPTAAPIDRVAADLAVAFSRAIVGR